MADIRKYPLRLLAVFSLILSAGCKDRLFDNPFDPQAGEIVFEVMNTVYTPAIAPRGMTWDGSTLWNARFWLDRKWKNGQNDLLLDLTYNKPLQAEGETWLGLQSTFNLDPWGQASFQGRYEVHDQVLANFSYAKEILNKIKFQLSSSYSQIRIGGTGNLSKIFMGDVNLSYSADLFNIAGDYYLNYDLFGNQRLTRPQLRLGFAPVTFYGGLLTATFQDTAIINNVRRDAAETQNISDNAVLNIAAKPIFFRPDTSLQVQLALEQFLVELIPSL